MPSKNRNLAAAALLVAAPLAQAGNVHIINNCDFEVFITPSQLGTDKPIECHKPGQTYTAPIAGEAVDLKVMTHKAFCFDDCVQLEYSVAGDSLFYDLSNINAKGMDKFVEYGISVETNRPDAPKVHCPPGEDQCTKGVYNEWWQNEATFCAEGDVANTDLTMHLCLENKGTRSKPFPPIIPKPTLPKPVIPKPVVPEPVTPESVVAAPKKEAPKEEAPKVAPAPPQTTLAPSYVPAAPKVEDHVKDHVHKAHVIGQNDDGSLDLKADVVMVTDIVTVATTVYVKRSEPTDAPMERRHIHRHAHAHGHNQ